MTTQQKIKQLQDKIKTLEKEWQDFHNSNPITSYSYPVWQVKKLEEEIKQLESKI